MKKRFFALMIIMLAVTMLGGLSSAEAAMSDRWSGDTIKIGYLARYAKLVSSADKGAILE